MLRPFFESRHEPYALVGGLALLAHGAPRATFDVDYFDAAGLAEYFDRLRRR